MLISVLRRCIQRCSIAASVGNIVGNIVVNVDWTEIRYIFDSQLIILIKRDAATWNILYVWTPENVMITECVETTFLFFYHQYEHYLRLQQIPSIHPELLCTGQNNLLKKKWKKNWEREKKNKLKTEKTKTKRRFWWTKTNCMPEWYDIGYAADTIIITSRSLAKSFYYDDARTYWCIENQSNRLEQWTINGTLRPISITVIDNLLMWYSAVQEERIKHNSIFSSREKKISRKTTWLTIMSRLCNMFL